MPRRGAVKLALLTLQYHQLPSRKPCGMPLQLLLTPSLPPTLLFLLNPKVAALPGPLPTDTLASLKAFCTPFHGRSFAPSYPPPRSAFSAVH